MAVPEPAPGRWWFRGGRDGYRPGMKLAYRVVSLGISAAAGAVAGAVFHRLWKLAGDERESPEATDRDRRWSEVLTAAALHGAVSGAVKAAAERVGARGFARVTGSWPTT